MIASQSHAGVKQSGAGLGKSPPAVVATTLDELDALRPVFERLHIADIDAQPDYFAAVVRHSPNVIRPHVVHLNGPGLDLLAVARIEDRWVPITLGYRTIFRLLVRTVAVSFGGLVGELDEERADRLLAELERPLAAGAAHVLVMPKVEIGSPMHQVVQRRVSRLRRGRSVASRRWVAPLPANLDEFLAGRSRKTRQTYRRQDRRLEERFGEALQVRSYRFGDDPDRVLGDLEQVAVKTYQHGLGASVSSNPVEAELVREGLRLGWFRAWVLYLSETPIAFWAGTVFGGTLTTSTPGFDPAYAQESVGRYTMFKMVSELCGEPDMRQLDFGHGEADYKESFGLQTRSEQDLIVYSASIRSLAVNAMLTAALEVNQVGRWLVNRSGKVAALKHRWRNSRGRANGG